MPMVVAVTRIVIKGEFELAIGDYNTGHRTRYQTLPKHITTAGLLTSLQVSWNLPSTTWTKQLNLTPIIPRHITIAAWYGRICSSGKKRG